MSAEERERWDQRYSVEHYVFGTDPSSFLEEHRALFPDGGRALDVAAGEGKNAVYLAGLGLEVLAVDISPVGLDKTAQLAGRRGVCLGTELRDLKAKGLPPGVFDVITCLHYMQRDLAPAMAAALSPGGVLLMELATVDNLLLHRRPSRQYLLDKNELKTWYPALEIVKYVEGIFEGYAVARLVAQKSG